MLEQSWDQYTAEAEGERRVLQGQVKVTTAGESLQDMLKCPRSGTVADRGDQTVGYLEF